MDAFESFDFFKSFDLFKSSDFFKLSDFFKSSDFFEPDAVPTTAGFLSKEFSNPSKQIENSLSFIEDSLDWYDHIACAFLLFPDPVEAFQKISMLRDMYSKNSKDWRHIVFRSLFQDNLLSSRNSSQKLAEALFITKNYKLLSDLNLQMYVKSDPFIDPVRLKLFKKIDNMSENDAKLWAKNISPEFDPSWCIEMHCLKWIEENTIPDEILSPGDPEIIPAQPGKIQSPVPTFEIRHGLCIIINQMQFYITQESRADENLGYRFGSENDRDKLRETFHLLGHDVEVYENLDRRSLLEKLEKISKNPALDLYDGLVMCILSHGNKGEIFTSDSIPVPLDEIQSYFDGTSCRALKDKPKLFFLQVCQGQKNQRQVYIDEIQNDGPNSTSKPSFSNFFEAWATVPGFSSYRSVYHGAIFIRELCSVLQMNAHQKGLLDLMTMVNDRVSSLVTPGNRIQMPCNVSCLTREVRFKRNEDKLVKAIVDQFEREFLERIIRKATLSLIVTDRATVEKTINLVSENMH